MTLAAVLGCYGIVIAALGTTLRRRRRRVLVDNPQRDKVAASRRPQRPGRLGGGGRQSLRVLIWQAVIRFNMYLHDDTGGGRAVAAAAMLLLRGSWPAIQAHFTAGELMSLNPGQSHTIGQLTALTPLTGIYARFFMPGSRQ